MRVFNGPLEVARLGASGIAALQVADKPALERAFARCAGMAPS